MEPDFGGWVTKFGVKCTDGRTISHGAFDKQDPLQVPLVWQHGHDDAENILGHVMLTRKDEGLWGDAYFNTSKKAEAMRAAVQHEDIKAMSIFANGLIERSKEVLHGMVREVSLVLAGANPGALIQYVNIRHADGDVSVSDEDAVIFTGNNIELPAIQHDDTSGGDSGPTIAEVLDTLNPEQKTAVNWLLGQALEEAGSTEGSAQHSDTNTNDPNKEGTPVSNVFEKKDDETKTGGTLSHAEFQTVVENAKRSGSLKAAFEDYALAHGINDIETLFPEAKNLDTPPQWITRRREWVAGVLAGTKKLPFTRIKSRFADLTFEDARAKGYIKGSLKKEQFFGLSSRETGPKTIYKKQKLDRDDMIDITDFDVVNWIKGEMRFMLDEEIARAILIGDGREVDDEDKIDEDKIRPIVSDDEFYSIPVHVNLKDSGSSINEFIDAVIRNRSLYRGSGNPALFTTEKYIAQLLLVRDGMNRRMYNNLAEVASELRVSSIVPVEVMEDVADLIAIMVNLGDYSVGTDRGGEVTTFEDFDIDYNQNKWLIETRLSGALTEYRSAMVFWETASTDVLVTPTAPTFDPESGEVTIIDTTHVVYKDGDGTVINAAGSPYTVAAGEQYTVVASPAAGYFFEVPYEWTFDMPPA